ncbi:jg4537 [Pararge aegeria aegeria]|uniref:Jg4537 protein n=1 Tax=Pararge aegeria aegeria TaxID=348720 RepID=A0A8S4RRS9_9NEOP|nr:jg4537 [Pararge aegeria aegeria]
MLGSQGILRVVLLLTSEQHYLSSSPTWSLTMGLKKAQSNSRTMERAEIAQRVAKLNWQWAGNRWTLGS